MTQGAGPRPIDAMIVGAQKGGTTALASYLDQHPAICSHRRMELAYFVDERDYALGWAANAERYFGTCRRDALLLGKSVTLMTSPTLVERLQLHNPAMRLIAVLRNPVDRAYSAYWWARQNDYESLPTFEAALDADPARHRGRIAAVRATSYVEFGRYADHLAYLAAAFPAAQLQVHLYEDLAVDAASVCQRTFEFLGVDSSVRVDVGQRVNAASSPRSRRLAQAFAVQSPLKRAVRRALPARLTDGPWQRLKDLNRTSFSPPPMAPATRARLTRAFAADNERLAAMLGRDLSAWSRLPD